MRSFLIAIAFVGICSCAGTHTGTSTKVRRPELYFDLRYPIYLVIDESFWAGCEKDPADLKVCHEFRVKQIKDGVDQWLNYFDKTTRPLVSIFSLNEQPSSNGVNKIIHITMEQGVCGKNALACWVERTKPPKIVFERPRWIIPRVMAHEFGHVLGRGDNDVPKGTVSIMSYYTQKVVELLDIKMVCELHHECWVEKFKLK